MKSLIDYLAGKDAGSSLTSRIDAKVKEAIAKSLWRKEYMTYNEILSRYWLQPDDDQRAAAFILGKEIWN